MRDICLKSSQTALVLGDYFIFYKDILDDIQNTMHAKILGFRFF